MINFETFKQAINNVKVYTELSEEMYKSTWGGLDLSKIYGIDFGKLPPELALLDLLENIFNDTNSILSEWCFKYDFGDLQYEDGSIKSEEDIYKILIENCNKN